MLRRLCCLMSLVAAGVLSVDAATISGAIQDSSGAAALGNVVVSLRRGFQTRARDTTGTDGLYSLAGVDTGTFTIRASASGYHDRSVPVTVGAGDQTINIKLVKIEYSSIAGIITDSTTGTPLSGAAVNLREGTGENTSSYARDTTGADGKYSFDSVANDIYTMRVTAPGYPMTIVEVTASGTAAQTVDVKLVAGQYSSVTGTITDSAANTPISGAVVSLRGSGLSTRRDTTGADGKYSFDSVLTGSYTVQGSAAGFVSKADSIAASGTGSQTVDLKLATMQYSSVTGTITDSVSDSPLAGAVISLREDGETIERDTTGADGKYSFDSVATGDYSVRASAAGHATKSVYVTAGGTGSQTVDVALSPSATVFTLRAGSDAVHRIGVSPNGLLRIDGFNEAGVVRIFGTNGKLVYSRPFSKQTTSLSLPGNRYMSGSYLISITQKDAIHYSRLVMQ